MDRLRMGLVNINSSKALLKKSAFPSTLQAYRGHGSEERIILLSHVDPSSKMFSGEELISLGEKTVSLFWEKYSIASRRRDEFQFPTALP